MPARGDQHGAGLAHDPGPQLAVRAACSSGIAHAWANRARATGAVIGLSTVSRVAAIMNGTVWQIVFTVHDQPVRRSELGLTRGRQ